MNITAIKLKNFKKFDSRNFEFQPGINVVYGENEAGKTTLLNAIITALYVDPSTRSRSLLDRILPWRGDSKLEIALKLSNKGKEYELVKNFGDKTVLFKNLSSDKQLEDINLVQEAIQDLTNIPTDTIYKSTALVRQSQMADVENSRDLMNAIQAAVSGGEKEGNAQEVLKQIKKNISDLTVGLNRPAKNPGVLKRLNDEYEKLQVQYNEVKKSFDKVVEARKSGKTSGNELEETESKIEVLEKLIENQKIYEAAQKDISRIDRQNKKIEEIVSRVEGLFDKKEKVQEKLLSFKKYGDPNLDNDVNKVSELEGQVEAKLKMIDQMSKKTAAVTNSLNYGLIILILVGITLSVLLGLFVNIYFLGLISLPLIWGMINASKFILTKGEDYSDQIPQVRESMKQDRELIKTILEKYGVDSKDGFYARKVRYITLKEEYSKLESEIGGVLGGRSLKEIKQDQIELLAEKREIETNRLTDEVKASQVSAEEYLRKRRELDNLKLNKRMLERKNIESEVRVQDSGIGPEDIAELEEKIELNKQDAKLAEHDLEVNELMYEVLEESINDLASNIHVHVVDKIESTLPQITDGRYTDARIENDFSIKVFSREKNDWVEPEDSLSAGTIDQIYFVYRVALLGVIEGDARVPLLLDDPFVTFDEKRKEEARLLLEREANDRQIILFTHDERYKEWGNIVSVG